jgi:filamentous hemagglutinin family protein
LFNRIYRLIWSQVLQAWVAVSENTRGRGKQSGSLTAAALSVTAALLSLVSPYAHAGPEGGQVVSGSGSISASGATTTINQTSDKLSINWQSFNVAQAETVNFHQPTASALAVNRIFDTQGSQILGKINANGQVWLINPNGVLFGKDAQINVGGLLASTLNPDDASIGSTRSNFSGSSTASVVNLGSINTTQGGYVAMLGHSVSNQGNISAPGGTVAMGAGSAVSLNFAGSSLLGLEVTSNQVNALAENGGLIRSDGGQVFLTAGARESLLASVVNSTGVIRADTAFEQNGKIVLSGGGSGVARLAGALSATGTAAGQTGGTVQVLGDKVLLAPGASIDVSGESGGGTVLVGGDYQGSNTSVQNASRVYVASDTSLKADATGDGNGGKVVVWADGDTRFAGSISARGGAQGGNGGFVEVSGKEHLDMQGQIDVAAPHGTGGNVLLDPQNIILSTGGVTVADQALNTPDLAFTDAPSPGTYTVNIASVTGFNELFLQATNNITVSHTIAMGAGNSIRLEANNNINVNAGISVTGAGSINLRADADSSGAGNLTLNAALSAQAGGITLQGFNITSNAAGTITSTGTAQANAGNISLTASGTPTASGNVNLQGAITSNGGNVSITSTSTGRGSTKTLGNINTTGAAGDGNFSITGLGAIIQRDSTALTIKGTTTLAAGTGNDITLDKANNNFSGAVSVISGKDVKLRDDIETLTLGNAAVSGNLEITTAGALTQSSDTTLTVEGTTTLIAGSNDIKLDNANNNFVGAVSVTSGKDVKLRDDIGTLTLGNAAVSGNLDVRTKGALTGTGALTVTGTTTLTAAAGENNENPQDITLNNENNNFTDAVSVTSGRNVTLHDVDTLKLGTSTISGDLAITTKGALTQSSGTTLTVGGRTTLTASYEDNETPPDPQDITLDNVGNNFTGAVSVGSGRHVSLRDADNLVLGASSVSGNLTITTNGALTQSSGTTLTVGGETTLAAGAGNDITLGNLNNGLKVNDFGGAVSVTSGNNVTLSDLDTLDLGASTVKGLLSIAAGGNVTQSGAVNAAKLVAVLDEGGLTLGAVNNKIDELGQITTPGGFTLNNGDNSVIVSGNITAAGSTVYIEAGSITDTGVNTDTAVNTITAETVNLKAKSDGGNIGSSFEAGIDINARKLIVNTNNADAFVFVRNPDYDIEMAGGPNDTGSSVGSGTLALTTATVGVKQSAKITAGTLNVKSNAAITLDRADNNAGTVDLQAFNGAAISYNDVNDFFISGINSGAGGSAGAVTLKAGGNVTQTGAGAVKASQLTADLSAGAGSLNLAGEGNNIAQLNTITTPGGFTLNNGNNKVTVAGDITATGTNSAVFIDVGTGSYTQNNVDISAGAGNITVVADTVAIGTNTNSNAFKTTGTLTLKPKTLDRVMKLVSNGSEYFELSTTEIAAISGGANSIVIGDAASEGVLTIGGTVNLTGKSLTLNAGSITDTSVKTIKAQTVNLNAKNGDIGTAEGSNGIDIEATNLSVNTSGNANASVRTTGNIIMGGGTNGNGSSVGGTLDLTATGTVNQSAKIIAGTLNVKTIAAGGAAITLTNAGNDADIVNLQTRNTDDNANVAGAIQYKDTDDFVVAAIATTNNVTLEAGGTVTQSGAVNAAQLTATLTGESSALNLGTVIDGEAQFHNNIAQLNAIDAPGGFSLTNGNNGVIVAGEIKTTNNAVFIDVGTGSYTQNDVDISAGAGNITVVADTVAIAANEGSNAFATSGTLTLKPKTQSRAMTLSGSGSSSFFDLSSAEITAFSGENGATNSIVIGDADSTGELTIGGAVNLAGKSLTLNAGPIKDTGVNTITATNVTLNANGQIGTGNVNGIDIDATNLSVNTSGNANAFVRTGAINIGVGESGANVGTGTLSLTANGAVTQTEETGNIIAGTLNVKAITTLTSDDSAAIYLTNAGNEVGKVNLQALDANDVNANSSASIIFINATGFEITGINNEKSDGTVGYVYLKAGDGDPLSIGNVTQTGAIKAAQLSAYVSKGELNLNLATNNIAQLNEITARDGFTLNNGNNALAINGSITITNPEKAISISTGSGAITFGDSGSIASNGGNVNLTNSSSNDMALGNINTMHETGEGDGNLTITSQGAVSQLGSTVLTIQGTTSIAAGEDYDVTLDSAGNDDIAGNDFKGAVSVTSGTNVTLRDINDKLTLGTTTISGKLTIDAVGTVTQTGAVTAEELSANLSARGLYLNGAPNKIAKLGNITAPDGFKLTNGDNPLEINGAISITDANDAVDIDTGSGALTFGENGSIVSGGGNVKLTNTSTDQMVLGTIDTRGAYDGDLTIESKGAISQHASTTLTIRGKTKIKIESGASVDDSVNDSVTLANADNDFDAEGFNGFVSVKSGNDVTLSDANELMLGAFNVGGKLDITAGGSVSQSLSEDTVSAAELSANASALFLTRANIAQLNTINTPNGFTLKNGDNDVTLAGNITVDYSKLQISVDIEAGSITDSGENTISAVNVHLKANKAKIDGGKIGSNTDRIDIAATNLSINTNNADAFVHATGNITLGGGRDSSVGTDNLLDLTATGAVTQGKIITAGTLNVKTFADGVAGAIKLEDGQNDVRKVNFQTLNAAGDTTVAADISYTNKTGFEITGINKDIIGNEGKAGNVTLQAGGNVTQSGAVKASQLTADLSAGSLNLAGAGNNIAQLNTITTPGGFTLNNGNNDVTVAGDITATGTNSAVSIDAGTESYTQNNNIDINAGTGGITITADKVAIGTNSGNNALTTSGTLTLKPKTLSQAMTLVSTGSSHFELSTAEIADISGGATGPIVIGDAASTGELTIGGAVSLAGKSLTLNAGSITDDDTTTRTITAGTVNLRANSGTIGSSNPNGSIDIVATNLSVYARNPNGNADAFVSATGDINMGTSSSSVGGTLDLTATGAVTQSGTGKIIAGTLNVKTLNADGAAIDLDDAANEVNKVNLQTRNGAAISYKDATGFEITGINNDSDTRGNVTLLAGGNVTQTGAVKAAELTADLSAGALTLDRTDNNIVQLNTIITPGGFTLKNGYNDVTLAGNITAATNSTVDIEAASITDTGEKTITAGTVNLKANVGRIGSSVADGGIDNGIDIAATNLRVNTSNNANAFVRATGDINIGVGNSGSSVGEGTLDLTATGTVNQSAKITAGTLNVKTLAASGAAITLTNDNNEVGKVNLQTLNGAAIRYTDATGFEITGINTGINSDTLSGGNVTLKAGGNVTQTGAIKAKGLALTGTNVDYTLENEDNAVTTLAALTGSVSYKQSGALVVGEVVIVNGPTVTGVTTTGTIKIETTGIDANLTLNNAVTSSEATGDAIILRAGSSNAAGVSDGGQLINEAGTEGIKASKGRYLVYSGDPDNTDEVVTNYAKHYNIGVIQPQNPGDPDETFVPTGTKSTFIYRRAPTLRVFANGGSKDYDGLAPDLTFEKGAFRIGDGFIDNDTAVMALTGALERRGGKNVLGGDDVLQGTLEGLMGYGIEYASANYTIKPKAITLSGITAANKTYDGTSDATVLFDKAVINGKVGTDDLTLISSTGSFADKNAGTYKIVSLVNTLGGNDRANYTITDQTTTATIEKKALTVSNTSAAGKTYDGNNTATITVGTLSGFVGDEMVSATARGTFDSKNAGSRTATASYTLVDGSNGSGLADNYSLADTTGHTATIAQKTLTVTGTSAAGKTYDGNNTATITVGTLSGFVGDEKVSAIASGTFDSKNAGIRTATASYTLVDDINGNGLADNYSLAQTTNHSATIDKRAITLSGITAANKTYDGRETATVLLDKADFNGKVSGDDLKVISSSGSFADKNAGTDKTVNLTNELGGNDLGNYTIAEQKTTTAKIDKANLTEVSASKTYDGLRTVKAQEMGVIKGVNGERFTARAGTADISDENVATANKTLTNLSGLELTGVDGGNRDNYNLDSGLPAAGDNNRVVIIERVTTPTSTSTSTQSASNLPPAPVVSAPPLPSDTSYVKAPLPSQNRPSFSWSLFFNRLFEEGAATVGNFVKQAPQIPAVKLTDELADNESQAVDSVGGDSTNSPSSSAPGASSGDTPKEAGLRKVNGFQNVVLQTNQRLPIQNKQR